jgi:hypothetical protein
METIILDINGNELHDGDEVCIRIDNLDKFPGYYHEAMYVFSTHPIFGMKLKLIDLTTQNNDANNQYIGVDEFTIRDIKLYPVERSNECVKYKFGIVGDNALVSFQYTDNIQKV